MRSSARLRACSNGSPDLATNPLSVCQLSAHRSPALGIIRAHGILVLGLLGLAVGHSPVWAQTAAKPEATVAGDISSLKTRVTAAEKNITSVKSRTTTAEKNITSLKSRATTTEGNVGTLGGKLGGVTQRVGTLETKSGNLDTGLQILGSKVDLVDGSFQAIDSKFSLLDNSFQTLGGKVDLLDGNFQAIDSKFSLFDQSFQTIGNRVDLLDGSFQAIEGKVNAFDGSFEAIDGGLKAIDGKVDGIDGVVKKVEKSLQKIDEDVRNDLEKSTTIDGKIDGLDGVVKKVDGKVDGLDGKLAQIDKKIDAKEEARDGRLDTIDGKLNRIDGGLRSVDDKVSVLDGNVLDLGGHLENLDSKIQPLDDLPRLIQEKLGVAIDPAVKDDIVTAFNKARQAIEERRQALGSLPAFVAPDDGGPQSECHAFRGELKSFLGAFATLFGSLPAVHPEHPTLVGLDGTLAIVDVIPCQALFFLSQAPLGLSGASQWLSELVASFPKVSDLFDVSSECQDVAARKDELRRAVTVVKAASILMKVISAKLHDDSYLAKTALALVPDASETTLGLHGYASVTLEQPKEKNRFANTFKKLSELLEGVADFGSTKVDQCELVAAQQAILQKLELRETVIEEAIQASEGRLRGDLTAEMNSLSERSLERVDDQRRAFDEWTGLALQLNIEEILSRESGAPVATLQLPAEAGGLLDLVRDIVQVTIEQILAGGAQVHNADKEWRKGNQSFAEGSFKEAYKHFAKAYRSATKADGGKDSDEDSDSD